MRVLRRTQFGNPILRTQTRRLSKPEILSEDVQGLIADMRYTVKQKKYGVGLASTQVGKDVAISIVAIKPTPTRPKLEKLELILINPEIVQEYGEKEPMWEGCISFGDTKNFPYAQVPRYPKVRVTWLDEKAVRHEQDFDGMAAHVLQHEIDHLNGILFVDRVEDPKSYMNLSEYKKMIKLNKR